VVLLGDLAEVREERLRLFELVGVEVHPHRVPVADHHHRVAELLEPGDEYLRLDALPHDDEVRAPPVAAVLVVGGERLRRLVVRDLDRLAAEARQDARDQQQEPVTPGVHDPVLGEHGQLVRSPIEGGVTRLDRDLEQLGQQSVLLDV
jgi:hypothetical protein